MRLSHARRRYKYWYLVKSVSCPKCRIFMRTTKRDLKPQPYFCAKCKTGYTIFDKIKINDNEMKELTEKLLILE